ncbi:helix-turn-helix domain-containing protein [Flavilitoribacter nigricans]|uniref:DNA-binding protein n=1 Tax=Flavilitoribacter nigricans (strain ATCC 23147 / DSM 23189 / NBRC 102662 / NCIMB 1420 / SS-2) TaxID=1122177 RepID=A0A2D0N769_FLAN2|nr:helix-turn-helix domain-containing protein [Flavilitoribacter nigricans]PHN04345.1 DNA-binding protein [Flavilitoribacter nigricans DSM 23189 = NBRC 102662]
MADFATNIPVICLESGTFRALVKELAKELKDEVDPFIDEKEAMRLLRITSKTTFQKYRDSGDIDYRIVSGKKYLYRRRSVVDFIENSPKTKD